MRKWLLIIVPVSILLGLRIVSLWDRSSEEKVLNSQSLEPPRELEEKSDNGEGGVTVSVRPLTGDKDLIFELAINTHSVDLTDFDILKNVRLISRNGTQTPGSWDEKEDSTHHVSGNLGFNNLEGQLEEFELVIYGLAGVAERKLKWGP